MTRPPTPPLLTEIGIRRRLDRAVPSLLLVALAVTSIVFSTDDLTKTVSTMQRNLSPADSQSRNTYDLLRDVSDLPVDTSVDIPYFWHIHKSAGSTMKHILYCMGRAQTRRVSSQECMDTDSELRTCRQDFGFGMSKNVINVDASSVPGIRRAAELRLANMTFPDLDRDGKEFVVATSRVNEAMAILTPERRGRLFALFRHPVDRAVSKYHYIKIATWERNYRPELANLTLAEFATSRYCYNNWVTRRLVHKMTGELVAEDLEAAKDVLRKKILVLLTNDIPGAADRVRRYFGWDSLDLTVEQENCLQTHIYDEPMNANPHPPLDSNSAEWDAIRSRNLYDIELMSLAQELYEQQGKMLASGGMDSGGGGGGIRGAVEESLVVTPS